MRQILEKGRSDSTRLFWIAFLIFAPLLLGGALHANELLDRKLRDAVKGSDAPLVIQLLSQGANPNVPSGIYYDAQTAVHIAASVHPAIGAPTKVLHILLESGGDCLAKDAKGRTPIYYAVRNNAEKYVEWLLDCGGTAVSATYDDSGYTPLHIATATGARPEVVHLLLQAGSSVDQEDLQGNAPLHLAIKALTGDRPEVIDLLLRAGADPDKTNRNGDAPLHLAVKQDAELGKVVSKLLEFEANPCINGSGLDDTPKFYAKERGYDQLVALLNQKIRQKGLEFGCPSR